MGSRDESLAASFEFEAPSLLQEIARARKRIADLPGVLDGELERFRDRVDKLLRESEVDNWRQVRIFLRDVDAIAADLAKAAKDRKLSPKHVEILDASLRRARKRDFYGARKVWRRLDKIVAQAEAVRRLQSAYRERYQALEARVRDLGREIARLTNIPKPPASPEEATAFVKEVEAFNASATAAYLDFLSRVRSGLALPLLLEASQGRGIGIPAPPKGTDPEPLLRLLAEPGPGRDELRARSFYGLLELPAYSEAKLAHLFGDARIVRGALEACGPWLKAIRDDERRSLQVLWSDDATMLCRRLPALVAFLSRIAPDGEAVERGKALEASLVSGRFAVLQTAARLYTTHGRDGEKRWRGELEKEVESMRKESAALTSVLSKLPEPARVEAGSASYPAGRNL